MWSLHRTISVQKRSKVFIYSTLSQVFLSLSLFIFLSFQIIIFFFFSSFHPGDPEYQEIGWQIFKSIERYCKTPIAYSAIQDVTLSDPRWTNSMQSYFFAETIKYLFLLFSPRDTIRLDEMVFNTEGHPLPIWK